VKKSSQSVPFFREKEKTVDTTNSISINFKTHLY